MRAIRSVLGPSLFLVTLAAGCAGGEGSLVPDGGDAGDGGGETDGTVTGDLTVASDLTGVTVDLTGAGVDLAGPGADLTGAGVDLAGAIADLTTPADLSIVSGDFTVAFDAAVASDLKAPADATLVNDLVVAADLKAPPADATVLNDLKMPPADAGIAGAAVLVAGFTHSCALLTDSTVRCWGRGDDGQLGDGNITPGHESLRPQLVPNLTDVRALAAGGQNNCAAVGSSGTVYCWGDSTWGQSRADGAYGAAPVTTPTAIPVTGALELACGVSFCCARTATGVICWGDNQAGEMGLGTSQTIERPHDVAGTSGAADIHAGGGGDQYSGHACARIGDQLKCWGSNRKAQMGTGVQGGNQTVAKAVPNLTGVTQGTVGGDHTCAVVDDGTAGSPYLKCWGANDRGQIGIGTLSQTVPVLTPMKVLNLSGVSEAAAATQFTCARSGATAKCWGYGDEGQLGDGSVGSPSYSNPNAQDVVNLVDITRLFAGAYQAGALRAANPTVMWGYNVYGQLGDNTKTNRPIATPIQW